VSTFVLVNPSSRSGTTGRRIPEIEALLRQHVGEYQLLRTASAGDGERLARQAVEGGATRLLIAGGDGTASEAVNGLLQCHRAADVEIGLLPLGTGGDFARVLGLGTDLAISIGRFANGKRRRIDAGRISYRANDGTERTRFFVNIASFGLSGESARWLAKRQRRGPLAYVMSALIGISRYKKPPVTVHLGDRTVHRGPLWISAVANGQYFGGGMHVAPGASIDDGVFDVVIIEGMSTVAALAVLPRVILGRHLGDPRITVHRAAAMRAESGAEVWVEADGEVLGTLPITIEVLPGAVRLCGLP
jgi:diacylglycerol kinase (ATP)